MKKFLPPSKDIMFKNLFGVSDNDKFTKDMLERLLDLETHSLDGLEIINSVKFNKETGNIKHFEMDIVVKLKSGEYINLEMQTNYDKEAEIKNVMYLSGIIYKSLKVGEDYNQAKKVMSICFVKNMKMSKHKKRKKLIQRYYVTNEDSLDDKILPDLYSMMLVSLEHNCEYLDVPERFKGWAKFLSAQTEEELRSVAETEPILMEAYRECERFMDFEYVQDLEADEKLRRSRENRHLREAEEKGVNRGKQEIAKSMLLKGITIKDIHEITKLPIKEIENLQYN